MGSPVRGSPLGIFRHGARGRHILEESGDGGDKSSGTCVNSCMLRYGELEHFLQCALGTRFM